MKNIGIIGTGFMGSAIMQAILREHREVQIGIVEKDPARREYGTRELGAIDFSAEPEELFGFSELVFLAIKPQDLAPFGESIGAAGRNAAVLSMLAGTPIATIAASIGTPRVIRIMPNLAAEIGKAVTGIAFADAIPLETKTEVLDLLRGVGTLIEVREELLNAITGVSGSGIAFAFEFINALALAGVEEGLPFPQALTAARDVVEAAALLLKSEEVHPEVLVSRVCSPGGTTIRGIRALHDTGFTSSVIAAVAAATERSRELEG
ncbi:MAG: pyrroline-5-carboxylate reductase [Alkalispirochaeta sp.]